MGLTAYPVRFLNQIFHFLGHLDEIAVLIINSLFVSIVDSSVNQPSHVSLVESCKNLSVSAALTYLEHELAIRKLIGGVVREILGDPLDFPTLRELDGYKEVLPEAKCWQLRAKE